MVNGEVWLQHYQNLSALFPYKKIEDFVDPDAESTPGEVAAVLAHHFIGAISSSLKDKE